MIAQSNKIKKQLLLKFSPDCLECGTRICSILNNCPPEALRKISSSKKCMIFFKGQRILMQEEEVNGIYFINYGKVKVVKADTNGKQFIIRFAKEGDALGLQVIDPVKSQQASAIALEDTLICCLDYKTLMESVRQYPEMAVGLIRYYNDLLIETENKSLKLANMNVRSKVADALITICDIFGPSTNNQVLNIPISRQDIASFIGSTKEQVSKILSELKSKGIIKVSGKKIGIIDQGALTNFA